MTEQTKVEWIAKRLREVRHSRGLTLKQVANRMGRESHTRVSDYEICRYVPNVESLLEMLDALSITPNDFFRDMPSLKETGKAKRPSRGEGIRPVAQAKAKAARLAEERKSKAKSKAKAKD